MPQKFLSISEDLLQTIEHLTLPNPLGFGQHTAPIMANCYYREGEWGEPVLESLNPLVMMPTTKIFHYGQQVFEGLKAYRWNNGHPRLFRLEENWKRFNLSAHRMAMPQISQEIFCQSVQSLVYSLKNYIPQGKLGESLYIRPVMIALDSGLSLASSSTYQFFVLASPSGSYFSSERVVALVERDDCRAAPGGTGAVKTSGNYGGSIKSAINARNLGFQQTLWLDPRHNRFVEEFSGMNFFAVIDGELHTPALKNTILPGITRDSILLLASSLGIKVHEREIDVDELINQIKSKRCTEVFACGTAAVITPVAGLGEKTGEIYELSESTGPVSARLKKALLNIQYGIEEDPFAWCEELIPQDEYQEAQSSL